MTLPSYLDDTLHFLQSALYINTLKIFGSLTGLRMNKNKSKLIWIGHKNFVKEKLNTSKNLAWCETQFSLLGLEFSTSLEKSTLFDLFLPHLLP